MLYNVHGINLKSISKTLNLNHSPPKSKTPPSPRYDHFAESVRQKQDYAMRPRELEVFTPILDLLKKHGRENQVVDLIDEMRRTKIFDLRKILGEPTLLEEYKISQ